MQLARELDQMQASYDAVVVGSGYGAGVAASRLARMGFSVAVLERGREFAIGEFPDTLPEATQEFQYVFNGRHEGKRTGLFELHYGRDMHVLVGCGLGGTSLINANVALPPDPRVWEDPRWPTELFDDDTLEEGFARARRMLRPVPYPNERPPLDKLTRLGEAATALGAELSRPPITVAFQAGPNAAAVVQPACNLCGDCCSGCNVGAKTTVQMTYLPDAANHGAEIFTGATVRHVKKEADGWRVLYTPTSARRDGFRSPERSIAAKIVVLGAGALGSTEILLRSRAEGLAVSDRLGQAFTGNGDVLAFAYNGDKAVNAVGVGVPARTDIAPPGPCITGAIDLRASSSLEEGMIIEEGVLPSGLAEILPATFSVGRIFGKDTDHGPIDELQETARRATSALLGTWRGAMHNTATFLVMAHDGSAGRLEMDDDGRIRVDWPGISKEPVFARVGDALRNASAANGATYVRNPMQNTFLGKNVITVHPLGGCGMGRDTSQGVVDHACRVYDASPGAGPDAVHDGLYVCDGAAIPRSLGVNPLLTITALAERAMMHVAKSSGRDLSDAPKADAPVRTLPAAATRPATGLGALVRKIGFHDLTRMAADSIATLKGAGKSAAPPPTPGSGRSAAGVEFTERMTGYLSDKPGIDYVEAVATGKAAGSDFSFTVAVRIADIDAFIRDSAHGGTLSGTAICPALSPDPLDISNGVFRLMRKSDEQVETRLFEYLMTLAARDGRGFEFKGIKYVHDDRRADLVADTTTLFIDLAEAGGTGSAARGILRIKPLDFARQVRTIKAVGGASHIERASAVAKFGALFAGQLFDIYGDIFAPVRRFDPARARKKRGLRAGEPEVHGFTTADGKRLRLTRYKGGTKGPLLFSHGLGVSSLIFRIDTIDTNLLEFMYEQGYDCWLLDFRASIDLPYARDTWTADDCAREDYQPAVDLIRRETGAPSIQVLAHCFGATTFVMSMLGGHLTGVRSAVISQIAADVIVPFYPQRLLAYLRLPAVFDVLGIPAVNARATVNDGLVNRIADGLIRVAVPFQREERSRNATSNRITALYGQLYETDQLNALTFETGLPEMFGDANIDAFKQLALIARGQTIVDAAGNDAYMPHLERLAIPISFIHGGENACFLPESTARTLAKLSARNGAHLYDRHVIPNYGHIDCIFGKSAVVDVYPKMLRHLEETAVLAR